MPKKVRLILQLLILFAFGIWIFPFFKDGSSPVSSIPTVINTVDLGICGDGENEEQNITPGNVYTPAYLVSYKETSDGEFLVVDQTEFYDAYPVNPRVQFRKELKIGTDAAIFMQTLTHAPNGDYCWDQEITRQDFKEIMHDIMDVREQFPECFGKTLVGLEMTEIYEISKSHDCIPEGYFKEHPKALYTVLPFVLHINNEEEIEKVIEKYIP